MGSRVQQGVQMLLRLGLYWIDVFRALPDFYRIVDRGLESIRGIEAE